MMSIVLQLRLYIIHVLSFDKSELNTASFNVNVVPRTRVTQPLFMCMAILLTLTRAYVRAGCIALLACT